MALPPLDTTRPFLQYTRPGIAGAPASQEGAGYISGPHGGSYANKYAQPMSVGAIYVYTDGKSPQIAFAGLAIGTGVTYMRGLDFCTTYLVPYGIKLLGSPSSYQQTIAQLGPFSSTNATGQAPGWAWSTSNGGGS
jgi:hypothetical protein